MERKIVKNPSHRVIFHADNNAKDYKFRHALRSGGDIRSLNSRRQEFQRRSEERDVWKTVTASKAALISQPWRHRDLIPVPTRQGVPGLHGG